MVDPRDTLNRLIIDRGDTSVAMSRLLGRNAAYVQQFIKRGIPKKLDEDDRRTLARYFGVAEIVLGGPAEPPAMSPPGLSRTRGARLIAVPQLSVGASAGPGALTGAELVEGQFGFDAAWLRRLTSDPANVSAIRVKGDSMMPTLADGDDILVDRGDAADRLRDGIYVLRIDDALNVKRIALNPAGRTVTIRSDNTAYPDWPDMPMARVDVIGRVIWVGRKVV
jgi:Peptidase S24-like